MSATIDRHLFAPAMSSTLDAADPAGSSKSSGKRRALIRATIGVFALMAIAVAAGASYEAISAAGDRSAYPSSGRMVDVGGHLLHLDCRGQGTPTVVLDAGLGGSSLDWILVQPEIASSIRVCAYDRAGMGWSEPSPSPLPRGPGRLAEELHLLLANSGVPGPFVLVAHSLAGKNVRMFASAYPGEVVGMVLVDTRSEHVDARMPKAEVDEFDGTLQMQGALYSVARSLGAARAFGASLVGESLVSPTIAAEMVLLQTQNAAIEEATAEGLARSADDAALAKSTLGSMPLVVIAAAASMADVPNWSTAQHELAALSTQGRLVVAEHSSHYIHLEEPGIVIDAIRQVVSKIGTER